MRENDLLNLARMVTETIPVREIEQEDLLPYLNEYLKIRRFPKGSYITMESVLNSGVYYVVRGGYYTLRVSPEGRTNLMARRQAPQFIGVDQAVDLSIATTTDNRTYEDCLIVEIGSRYFVDCLRDSGELSLIVIQNLCAKLSNASHRVDRMLFSDSRENLILYILSYWRQRDLQQNEPTCRIAEKNMYIADEIGASTRTLYRVLNKLKQEDLIKVKGGCIVVTKEQIGRMEQIVAEINKKMNV